MKTPIVHLVMVENKLPRWSSIWEKQNSGDDLTSLEKFILDQEPSGIEAERTFRKSLLAVVLEWYNLGHER